MFEGLDDLPWSTLTHAYGEASDVPALIRSLVSPNEEERSEALHELFGNIRHQGTVYEATGHALPFLIEAMQADEVPDTDGIALLVACIISGKGYHQVHSTRPMISPFTRRPVPPPPNLDELLAQERRNVDHVVSAGAGAVDLLVPYLAHESADVRASVAEALGRYPSRAEDLTPALRTALRDESEEEAREALDQALRTLTGVHRSTGRDD